MERPSMSLVERPKLQVAEKPKLAVVESRWRSRRAPATKDKTTQTDATFAEDKREPTPSTSSTAKETEPTVQASKVEAKKPSSEKPESSPKSSANKQAVPVKSGRVEQKIEKKVAAEPAPKPVVPLQKTKTDETDVKKDAARLSPERKVKPATSKDSVQTKSWESTPSSSIGSAASVQAAANGKSAANGTTVANGKAAVDKTDEAKSPVKNTTKSAVNPPKPVEVKTAPVASNKPSGAAKASAPKVSIPGKKVEPSGAKGPQTPTVTSPTPPQTPTTPKQESPSPVSVPAAKTLKVDQTIPATPPASSKTSTKPALAAQAQAPTPTTSTARQPATKTAGKKRSKNWILNLVRSIE